MTMHNPLGSFAKRMRSFSRLDPARDWIIAFTVAAILLAGIIVWNVWAFDTVAQGGVIGPATTTASPIFSQSSLDAIRTIFANRAAEEVKYTAGAYRFPDPSL